MSKYKQLFPNGTRVQIHPIGSKYDGEFGTIVGFDSTWNEYTIKQSLFSSGFLIELMPSHFTVLNSPNPYSNRVDTYYDYIQTPVFKSSPKSCNHRWKGIVLVMSTVYNCEICGVKKEEADKDNEIVDDGVPF